MRVLGTVLRGAVRAALAGALALPVTLAAAVPAGAADLPADAPAVARLPFDTASGLAVAGGAVFVSSVQSSTILVTDPTGQWVAQVPGEPAVSALASSPDGSTVWALSTAGRALSAVDAATRTERARYDVSALGCPVAFTPGAGEGYLYVLAHCGGLDQPATLGVVDLTVAPPALSTVATLEGDPREVVALADGGGTELVVHDGSQLLSFSAAGAAVTAGISVVSGSVASIFTDRARSALFEVSYGGLLRLAPDTLTAARTFTPHAMSTAAVGTASNGHVLTVDYAAVSVRSRATGAVSYATQLRAAGHAWAAVAPDAPWAAVVVSGRDATNGLPGSWLTVFPAADEDPSRLTLAGPGPAHLDRPLTVSGRLSLPVSGSPAGATVRLVRRGADGTVTALPDAVAGDGGEFSVTDTTPGGGWWTYTATWAGDGLRRGSTASARVYVTRPVDAVGLSVPPRVDYGKRLVATARFATGLAGAHLLFYVLPAGATRWSLLCDRVTDSASSAACGFYPARRGTVRVLFRGDPTHEPVSATAAVTVLPTLSVRQSRWWTTWNGYRVYHAGTDPLFTLVRRPADAAGRVVEVRVDRYLSGRWVQVAGDRFLLGADGGMRLTLLGPHARGAHQRIRFHYLGDSTYPAVTTPWLRFAFSR